MNDKFTAIFIATILVVIVSLILISLTRSHWERCKPGVNQTSPTYLCGGMGHLPGHL